MAEWRIGDLHTDVRGTVWTVEELLANGRVRMAAGDTASEGSAGDLLIVPDAPHTLLSGSIHVRPNTEVTQANSEEQRLGGVSQLVGNLHKSIRFFP